MSDYLIATVLVTETVRQRYHEFIRLLELRVFVINMGFLLEKCLVYSIFLCTYETLQFRATMVLYTQIAQTAFVGIQELTAVSKYTG